MRKFIYGLIVGVTVGVGSFAGFYVRARNAAERWRGLHSSTRDEWLKDRGAWRDGKAFAYHYGPHGERW